MSASTATILDPSKPRESSGVSLRTSSEVCRRIARDHARNFYYGMMLTPGPKRAAMYAIYAWMRTADDLADAVDAAGHDPGDSHARTGRCERLDLFRRHTAQALDSAAPLPPVIEGVDPRLWPAVRDALLRYGVPGRYLFEMIEGQLLDQQRDRYERFDQLYDYCYKVASTVGLVCITIWGYSGGERTRTLAEQRGVALQLTNVLRDLVEDARRGRVYLPAEELDQYGYDPDRFLAAVSRGEVDQRFDRLMAFQLERARRYYEATAELEAAIEPGCRPTCWAMMHIYRRLLDKISARPRRVLTERVSLGRLQKLTIAARASWRRGVRR